MSYQTIRNIVLLFLGAVILVLEIEWHDESRGWVIALALILMGIVTLDEVRQIMSERGGKPTPPTQ